MQFEYEITFLSEFVQQEVLSDYLKTLVDKNEEHKQRAHSLISSSNTANMAAAFLSMNCLNAPSAEYVISLCELWKLSDEVKFLAFEVLNQFMNKLMCELYCTIWLSEDKYLEVNSSESSIHKKDNSRSSLCESQWKSTIEHVSKQMELRAVSSVALASKFISVQNKVTSNMAINYLNSRGYAYKKSILFKSEVRILKYLDFNMYSVPCILPYIGAMLQSIASTDRCFNGSRIYKTCVELLHCFYQRRTLVYARLWQLEVNTCGIIDSKYLRFASSLLETMSDKVYLACAMIASATYLLSRKHSDRMIVMLRKMTTIPDDDIAEFAHVLMDVLLTK
ncbi:cyclin N-terminal domain-containing protein 1-like [Ciona intestinalis]